MTKVFIMVGVPGAGKSTLAKELAEKEHAVILSADNIREELYGDVNIQGDGKKVFGILYSRIRKTIKSGKNLIIDNTSVDRYSRSKLIEFCTSISDDLTFYAVVKDVPLEVAKERNANRVGKVLPVEVLEKFHKKFKFPSIEEGFAEIITSTT